MGKQHKELEGKTMEEKQIIRQRDMIEHLDPPWDDDLPTKEGWYWAYGYAFKEEMISILDKMMKKPEIFIVHAIKVGTKGDIELIRNGDFWEEGDRGYCVFKRISKPLGPMYFDIGKAIAMDKDPRLGKYMKDKE